MDGHPGHETAGSSGVMLDKTETIKALGSAIGKMTSKLIQKERELTVAENRSKGWNPRRCNRLREEIESLKSRLERAERLQDRAASGGS